MVSILGGAGSGFQSRSLRVVLSINLDAENMPIRIERFLTRGYGNSTWRGPNLGVPEGAPILFPRKVLGAIFKFPPVSATIRDHLHRNRGSRSNSRKPRLACGGPGRIYMSEIRLRFSVKIRMQPLVHGCDQISTTQLRVPQMLHLGLIPRIFDKTAIGFHCISHRGLIENQITFDKTVVTFQIRLDRGIIEKPVLPDSESPIWNPRGQP